MLRDVMSRSPKIPENIRDFVAQNHEEYLKFVFTAKSFDETVNYEFHEILGDSTINKFVIWYFSSRFTTLGSGRIPTKDDLQLITLLKCQYVGSLKLAEIGREFGFAPFIRASYENKVVSETQLLEDVLEAFVGMTERIIDDKYGEGKGYLIVKYILESYYDSLNIPTDIEVLKDPKTRLKELMDKQGYSHLQYRYDDDQRSFRTKIIVADKHVLADVTKQVRKDVRQKLAAEEALKTLNKFGGRVSSFCEHDNKIKDAHIQERWRDDARRRSGPSPSSRTGTSTTLHSGNYSEVREGDFPRDCGFGRNMSGNGNVLRQW